MEVKMLLLLVALGPCPVSGGHHGGFMPGFPTNISRNDPALLRVVLGAAYSFNNQSNDAFLFKPSSVQKAQQQVVKGVRYIVDFQISRTICPKRNQNQDLYRCDFQPTGQLQQVSSGCEGDVDLLVLMDRLPQTIQCHLDLWLIPWKHGRETLELLCRPEAGPIM